MHQQEFSDMRLLPAILLSPGFDAGWSRREESRKRPDKRDANAIDHDESSYRILCRDDWVDER
jgi:hypothetical protein